MRNDFSYKTRNGLKIYKSFELESTFVKIGNPKKANIITGCFYIYSIMNINEFTDDYLRFFFFNSSYPKIRFSVDW